MSVANQVTYRRPSPDADFSEYEQTLDGSSPGTVLAVPTNYTNINIEKKEYREPLESMNDWRQQQSEWMKSREEQWQKQQEKMDEMQKQIEELQQKNPLAPYQGYQGSPPEVNLAGVKRARTPIMAAIEDFSPVWYAIAMNTGILGIVLSQFPYPFKGLENAITDIFYALDILLVIVISAMHMLRFMMFPKPAYFKTRGDPDELALWGCFPIAVLTIAALTATQVSNAYWGGHWATIVAVVLWWGASTVMFIIAVFATVSIFRNGIMIDRQMTATLMIPAVGLATAAAEAGFICNYAFDLSARLAVPMLIMGYFYVGTAFFLALSFYVIFIHRLFSAGFPPAAKAPGMLMMVGPMGQVATALQTLSSAAYTRMDFAGYNRGTFLTASSAPALSTAAILISLLCLGFAYYWIVVALIGIGEYGVKKQLSYSMMWWSTIFPLGTVCTAWLELSVEMNSPTFKVLTTALWLILFIDYLINWAFTFRGIFAGKLLFTRSKEDIKQQLLQEKDVNALEANFREEMRTPGVVDNSVV